MRPGMAGNHPIIEELAHLTMDMADALDSLPVEQRNLAEQLKSHSLSEIARKCAVPRTSLYHLVRSLMHHLEKAGLKEYLDNPPSSRPPSA